MCAQGRALSLMGVPEPMILRARKNSVRVKVGECHESYNLRGGGEESVSEVSLTKTDTKGYDFKREGEKGAWEISLKNRYSTTRRET